MSDEFFKFFQPLKATKRQVPHGDLPSFICQLKTSKCPLAHLPTFSMAMTLPPQKNKLNTLRKMLFNHSGNTQKNRTIKAKPIQLQAFVNAGEGLFPVIIS